MYGIIGNIAFWAGKPLLLVIIVMLWWAIFMTSGDPWDILGGLIVLAMWCAGIYLGIKKGLREAEEMGLT